MTKVLLPVDGSPGSDRAVRYVLALLSEGAPLEVDVINVQPPIESAYIRRFVTHQMIDDFQREEAGKALASATALLEQAGVRHERIIEAGYAPEAIARRADAGYHRIVIGTRGMSAAANLLLGSVAARVVHLAEVPVTLVP